MLEVLDALYIGAMIHIKNFFTDEKGSVDLVTIVILVAIAIGLAVIFKNKIVEILTNMFDSMDQNTQNIVPE